MCLLCHAFQAAEGYLFCHNCYEVTLRLPRFLRSPQAREFVQLMLKEALQKEEFDKRAFPPHTQEVRDV